MRKRRDSVQIDATGKRWRNLGRGCRQSTAAFPPRSGEADQGSEAEAQEVGGDVDVSRAIADAPHGEEHEANAEGGEDAEATSHGTGKPGLIKSDADEESEGAESSA